MRRVLAVFTQEWPFIFLCVIFYVLMFFGEGVSTFIDTMAASVTILLFGLVYSYRNPARVFPTSMAIPWGGLLLYLLGASLFSIDIGYSLRYVLRVLNEFLLFYIFYVYAPVVHPSRTKTILFAFCGIAFLSAIGFTLFPLLRTTVPTMNLFWSSAGHNHVTDLLLLSVLPLLMLGSHNKKRMAGIILVLFGIFIFFQARIAFIVVVATLFFVMMVIKKRIGLTKPAITAVLVTCLGLSALVLFAPTPKYFHNPFLEYKKTSVFEERRPEYWRQAIQAIRDRPIFGHGPGSFLLLSKKYQQRPVRESWFAHNAPLETLAETGIIGAGLWIWVLVLSWIRPTLNAVQKKTASPERVILLLSPIPLLVYSLFDFSLNYFVVFALFWSLVGSLV